MTIFWTFWVILGLIGIGIFFYIQYRDELHVTLFDIFVALILGVITGPLLLIAIISALLDNKKDE
jgi:multisubunit Na+/H+ antiporter MnhG subunit